MKNGMYMQANNNSAKNGNENRNKTENKEKEKQQNDSAYTDKFTLKKREMNEKKKNTLDKEMYPRVEKMRQSARKSTQIYFVCMEMVVVLCWA